MIYHKGVFDALSVYFKNRFSDYRGLKVKFVFPATGAAEKLIISENRIKGGFQGGVGGIGGSGVQSENLFSANGIPANII